MREPMCSTCEDYGFYYIHDASTDAVIGTRRCDMVGNPWNHPVMWKRDERPKFPVVVDPNEPPF